MIHTFDSPGDVHTPNLVGSLVARRAALLAMGLLATGAFGDATFIDRGPESGVTALQFGRGSAMIDLDGDGLLDIVAGNAGMTNNYYRQRPDHSFEHMNAAWCIPAETNATWGVLVADFDNDGDPDVYSVNGGFTAPQPNALLRNDLDTAGCFVDVSAASGDADDVGHNFGGTAFDFDRDGDLDIFLTTRDVESACVLLRNDGDLVFANVSLAAGIIEIGNYRHCSSGDYDNDGWPDVGVGNATGENRLYRNNRDGTFAEVAVAVGIIAPDKNFGFTFDDFDNDGWLDAYIPKYQLNPTEPSRLFLGNGDGTFRDVTSGTELIGSSDMGHNTADLTGDGYPDILVGTGNPGNASLDIFYRVEPDGDGDVSAVDIAAASGIQDNGPTRSHGMAIGDYDQDGIVDVFINNGGPDEFPDTAEASALWQGQPDGRLWIELRLTAVVSNRANVGARAVATLASGREIHRRVHVGHGFANTVSPILHVPFTAKDPIERVDLWWPSGAALTIDRPGSGQIIDVIEPLPCLPDVDHDGTVGFVDLVQLITVWGPCTTMCDADLDWDGTVGFSDLVLLISLWGPCAS